MPAIVTKLQNDLGYNSNQVKIIDEKTLKSRKTEVFLQGPSIALCLGTYRPALPLQGASRYGFRIKRELYILVETFSLSDPAGRAEIALATHWNTEDLVLNSLVESVVAPLFNPLKVLDLDGTEYPFMVDNGRYSSVIGIEIEYVAALTIPCV